MFDLAMLLADAGIDPEKTLVFRHRPWEPRLRQVLGWLAEEQPDLFNLYQSTHGPRTESALMRAQYLASFIGHTPGKAVFVGLYARDGETTVTWLDCKQQPGFARLIELGMSPFDDDILAQEAQLFELRALDALADWKGKLVVQWPPPDRSWYRWGGTDRNCFPVAAIYEDSLLVREIAPWDELVLNWSQLNGLPTLWRNKLAEWRGVYLIFDTSDGKSYMGSASGSDNLLGRWLDYASSGHGGNRLLKSRDHRHFQFSILQRVSPDLPPDDVTAIETTWKVRLHTRAPFGLNAN